ncbi:MAG: hypothetical protein K2K57_13320 [Oscillospiraceae bacterium]|nr:hypothetical protein [Oscillospiraceae bacterium]
MTVAVIGSDEVTVNNIGRFIPANTTEIAVGLINDVDEAARKYAHSQMIGVTTFMPLYDINGQELPLNRIEYMIKYADEVIAFWDSTSKNIRHAVKICKQSGVPINIYIRGKHDWVKL